MSYDASEHLYEIKVFAYTGAVHTPVRCTLHLGMTCLKDSAAFEVHLAGMSRRVDKLKGSKMTLAASKNEALADTDTIGVAIAMLEQGFQACS